MGRYKNYKYNDTTIRFDLRTSTILDQYTDMDLAQMKVILANQLHLTDDQYEDWKIIREYFDFSSTWNPVVKGKDPKTMSDKEIEDFIEYEKDCIRYANNRLLEKKIDYHDVFGIGGYDRAKLDFMFAEDAINKFSINNWLRHGLPKNKYDNYPDYLFETLQNLANDFCQGGAAQLSSRDEDLRFVLDHAFAIFGSYATMVILTALFAALGFAGGYFTTSNEIIGILVGILAGWGTFKSVSVKGAIKAQEKLENKAKEGLQERVQKRNEKALRKMRKAEEKRIAKEEKRQELIRERRKELGLDTKEPKKEEVKQVEVKQVEVTKVEPVIEEKESNQEIINTAIKAVIGCTLSILKEGYSLEYIRNAIQNGVDMNDKDKPSGIYAIRPTLNYIKRTAKIDNMSLLDLFDSIYTNYLFEKEDEEYAQSKNKVKIKK